MQRSYFNLWEEEAPFMRLDARPMPIMNILKYVRRASSTSCPVVFTKNAFGVNAPYEDLYVSPNHGMVDRKGRLFPAKKFVNNSSIFQDPTFDTITYYHIELERHCTVLANGVLAETYNLPKNLQKSHNSKWRNDCAQARNAMTKAR